MGENSKIQWTHHTLNPVIGCTKVSPGCANCYAETMDKNRFSKSETFGAVSHWGPGAPRYVKKDLEGDPLAWDRKAAKEGVRKRVFCASLADVFDPEWPPGVREALFALIRRTTNLDWLLLTKRPENFASMLPPDWGRGYHNVWLGVTVEDQQRANERIPLLASTPARVRFLSCEPLLEHVSLQTTPEGLVLDEEHGPRRIHWIIVGGESGDRARPFDPEWARSIIAMRSQAAVFVKQMGARPVGLTLRDSHGGDADEWPEDLRMRDLPEVNAWPR